eukprot:PhF_6_TR42823/c0_g1_i1/m.64834
MLVCIGDDDVKAGPEHVGEEDQSQPTIRPLSIYLDEAAKYVALLNNCDLAAREGFEPILDACDQLTYFSAAESHRCNPDNINSNSQPLDEIMPQVKAFPAVVRLLSHERTAVVLAGFGLLRSLLERRDVHLGESDCGLLLLVPQLMSRLPNKEEIQRDCIYVATALGSVPKCKYVREILGGPIVALTLTAMDRFPANVPILHGALQFFAALCSQSPQIGELFIQCGNVADFVTKAMMSHPTHSGVQESGALVLGAMSEHEGNHEVLLGTPFLAVLLRAIDTHYSTPMVVKNSFIAISGAVPSLDLTQRQALVGKVAKVLKTWERQQVSVVCSCAALVIVLAQSANSTPEFKMFVARHVVELLGKIHQETEDVTLGDLSDQALRSLSLNKFRMK